VEYKKGDKVTCKHSVEAYYSNYGGNPFCEFEPGDIGTIVDLKVPSTTHNRTFTRVTFDKIGQSWSAALLRDNIERITNKESEMTRTRSRSHWYVGLNAAKHAPKREIFSSKVLPTKDTHGHKYAAVWGPFRTKRGALFGASPACENNPHVITVADAERIARDEANEANYE